MMMRPFYRVWQFWQLLTARPLDTQAAAEIEAVLSHQQRRLFGRFSVSEQQHSYRVFAALCRRGQNDPDLLAAALLHDIGKTTAPRSWWDRVVVVLGQAFAPSRAAVWAKGGASGLTRPFVVKARHAEWGATLAKTAGSSPTTVALIRRHHTSPAGEKDPRTAELLALLQWADDNN